MEERPAEPTSIPGSAMTHPELKKLMREALAVLLVDVTTCETWLQCPEVAQEDLQRAFRRMRAAVHRAVAAFAAALKKREEQSGHKTWKPWASEVIIRVTLKGIRNLEDRLFVERLTDDLKTYREPIWSKTAWDRRRWEAGHIERSAKSCGNSENRLLF